MQFLTSAPGDTAHFAGWNAEKLHQLTRAHVPCPFQFFWVQGAKSEFVSQLVQDRDTGIESIGNRSIEIENQQLGSSRRLCGRFSASQNIASKSSHAVTGSLGTFIVPLNFASSDSSPKLTETRLATRSISSLDRRGLSEASTNARS